MLADLLSIPFGERYPPLQFTEAVQKQRTMEVLEEQLVLLSQRDAVLVLFEDAHWIDPTSIALMDRIDSQSGGPAGNDHCDLSA